VAGAIGVSLSLSKKLYSGFLIKNVMKALKKSSIVSFHFHNPFKSALVLLYYHLFIKDSMPKIFFHFALSL